MCLCTSTLSIPNLFSDALLIDATLNGFAILARARPAIAPKIVSAVLSFNPLKNARPGLPPKEKVRIQSMERTTSAFLLNYTRKYVNSEAYATPPLTLLGT